MMRTTRILSTLALAVVLTVPAFAQEKAKGKKRRGRQPQAIGALNKSLQKANLTEEQQKKVKEIFAKYAAKLKEVNQERTQLIGAETLKKMNAARKKAQQDGKKGKALQEAALSAAGLTGEKLEKFNAIRKKNTSVTLELKKEIVALLTDEQKQSAAIKLPKARKKKKNNQ